MEKLAIWGAAGHAKVVADIVRLRGDFSLLGFLDDQSPVRKGEVFAGSIVLGGAECLPDLREQNARLILGFGNGEMRLKLGARLQSEGFVFASALHPRSIIALSCRIEDGVVVAAGSIINPDAHIGRHVIINTGAAIDHDCVIGDGASIAPGVHLAGNVSVGRAAMVGIGSVARERIRIGDGCVIGAGSVIVSDIPDGVLAFGVPAKVIRKL